MQELNLKMLKHSALGSQDSNALEVSDQMKKSNFEVISSLEVLRKLAVNYEKTKKVDNEIHY